MTTRQLALVDPGTRPASWRLDDRTREIGLRGVAEGRRILREAAAREAAARTTPDTLPQQHPSAA